MRTSPVIKLFAHEKPNSFYTSYDDMLSILKEVDVLDELMLVEFMPGNEYTVDLLAHKGYCNLSGRP